MQVLAACALFLAGCAREPAGTAPDAPREAMGTHTFRAPTLACRLDAPPGWTINASPMPDHLVEALAPDRRGRMILREADQPTVPQAVAEQARRTEASWGGQPDFSLLREQPYGESGRLLAFQWRPSADAPVERHLIAAIPTASAVVLAYVDDDGATPEAELLAALATLTCAPK